MLVLSLVSSGLAARNLAQFSLAPISGGALAPIGISPLGLPSLGLPTGELAADVPAAYEGLHPCISGAAAAQGPQLHMTLSERAA